LIKGDKKQCEGHLDLDFLAVRENLCIERDQINIKSELRSLVCYSAFKNNNVLACLQLLKDDDYIQKYCAKGAIFSHFVDTYFLGN